MHHSLSLSLLNWWCDLMAVYLVNHCKCHGLDVDGVPKLYNQGNNEKRCSVKCLLCVEHHYVSLGQKWWQIQILLHNCESKR